MVDSSDVTVWYKVGIVALKLDHYPLASHAFEQVRVDGCPKNTVYLLIVCKMFA